MDITPAIVDGKKLIEAYGPGRFRISGKLYEHAVIVCDEQVIDWQAHDVAALTAADFAPLLTIEPRPSLILLGTGATQVFPSKELKHELRVQGFTVEAMSSDAACRTYNVLLAEGRPVAAALLPL